MVKKIREVMVKKIQEVMVKKIQEVMVKKIQEVMVKKIQEVMVKKIQEVMVKNIALSPLQCRGVNWRQNSGSQLTKCDMEGCDMIFEPKDYEAK